MANSFERFTDALDNAVREFFANEDGVPEEDDVRKKYDSFYASFSILYQAEGANKEEIIDKLVTQYLKDLAVTKKLGFAYSDEETKPWLNDVECSFDWYYWKRYKNYLYKDKKWAQAAVRSIENDTRAVLDLMADPNVESGFERRGLVVASVQSGKTANYIGLICRAADAGYKIIIVMAGVHNVLRNQTQARLEEGFTGFNIVDQQNIEEVGVGKNAASRRPIACTSREADFNKSRANALRGIQTGHTNEPWLFVIKKNSNSLKQVYEWLKVNADPNDQLLLIDDEADNASINGKYKREKRDDEPTRINGQIRNILNFFTRRCYVGYTATPFANILIDPDIDNDTFGKDLFPRSFIYTLEESSNYFGASKVFADYDDPHPRYLRFIDDIDTVLPPKHKSDFEISCLPASMKEAVRAFLLATTIRALRGDVDAHSTMMINASPYKIPQRSVSWRVRDYLKQLIRAAQSFASLDSELAISLSKDIADFHTTWEYEYSDSGDCTWEQVQHALFDSIKTVRVVSINTDSNDILDYEHQVEHVIAVGGYRLSRGLTLEGLVVSYYSRNAKAYDALMQMARWFGYRPGYEDLCRIWMSSKAAGWYKFVADSTEDLFDELRDMRQAKRTPRDYGLKIRQCPDSLTVTARNKMGTGQRVKAPIDLNNGFVETVAFDRRQFILDENQGLTTNLISKIAQYYVGNAGEHLFCKVPAQPIIDFLTAYINEDAYSKKSQTRPVLNYIDGRIEDGELLEWDVLIAQGFRSDRRDLVTLPVVGTVPRERRYPGGDSSQECLVVGEKNRLASRGVEKAGLTPEQVRDARNLFHDEHPEKKSCSDRYYRRMRTRPLLVLHPVALRFDDVEQYKDHKFNSWPSAEHCEYAFGWSISFPYTDKHVQLVDYIFNEIAIRNISADFDEDSDDNYEDD